MRVLLVGDSPLGKTGFGRTNSHALKAFLAAGFEVGIVTALQTKRSAPTTDLPVTLFVPEDSDESGLVATYQAIETFKPDVVYGTGDPGGVGGLSAVIPQNVPFVAYVPIEGEPILNAGWRQVLSQIDFFTCSQYGVRVVHDSIGRDIDYVYHGVDRDVFRPMDDEERALYRKRLGWDGKFVVSCVAQNVRRKQLPRLIEAISILKHQYKQNDIILYLHTVPFQGHWLEGWQLSDIAQAFDVYHEVVFNPLMAARGSSVPDTGTIEVPGVRELVGSSDAFVNPAQVEGFSLPTAEAMGCGIPVIVTKYAAGWEIANKGLGIGIQPNDWETYKSGSRYANISPADLAKAILSLKRNPKQRARMREAGLKAVREFDWSVFEAYVVQKVIDANSKAKTESDATTQTDQASGQETQDVLRHREGRIAEAAGAVHVG